MSFQDALRRVNAERSGGRSHVERGNETGGVNGYYLSRTRRHVNIKFDVGTQEYGMRLLHFLPVHNA